MVQRDSLDHAREAFRSGNHPEALKQYEHFFDHALDDDPHSLYGVRLSYCLDEWARLGKKYPPALRRLEERAQEALSLLEETRNPERFHDFTAICRYLNLNGEPVRRFLLYHLSDSDLATSIVRFIWDELVRDKQWAVCVSYLGAPKERYDMALLKFDQSMKISKGDPSLGGKDFEKQIRGWYVRDVANLLLVLRNIGATEEAASVEAAMENDMCSRDVLHIAHEVRERIAR